MGNKVNPIGLRLGVLNTWNSRWFFSDRKLYRSKILEDLRIRNFLLDKLRPAGIVNVEIERNLSGINLILHAARPGIIIGHGGKGLEEIKNEVLNICKIPAKSRSKFKLEIKVEQIKKPFLSAVYTAEYLRERIVKNFSHRSLVHKVMDKVMESGAAGVKVVFSGRIRGANIARREKYQQGKVPLSSIKENIDYAIAPALTRNGYVGIKVFICL